MSTEGNSFYYLKLNKEERQIYHRMYEGLLQSKDRIELPFSSMERLYDLFFMLRLDHPEIFYADTFTCRYAKGADQLEMLPVYTMEKGKIKDQREALKKRVLRIVKETEGRTEKEKELFIHDFICENVRYDKLKKPYSHDIIGPLGHGVGVCEGIAKSVKALCDAAGIWCIIVLGNNNPEKKIKYRHTWNIVEIEGKKYHLDATFDLTLSEKGVLRHDYFNLDDGQITRDHEPYVYPAIPCTDHDHFYYLEKKLSFTKEEEVIRRYAQCLKKGKPFLFHWRGGYLTVKVLTDLLEGAEKEAEEKGKYVTVSVNWAQAVLLMQTESIPAIDKITIEKTDEAEEDGEIQMNEQVFKET